MFLTMKPVAGTVSALFVSLLLSISGCTSHSGEDTPRPPVSNSSSPGRWPPPQQPSGPTVVDGPPSAQYKLYNLKGTFFGYYELLPGGKYRTASSEGTYSFDSKSKKVEWLTGFFKKQAESNVGFVPDSFTGTYEVLENPTDQGKNDRLHMIWLNRNMFLEYLEENPE